MARRADAVVRALLTRCSFPPPGAPAVCAFSGGPDSTALVVLAVAAGCDARAVHVDHGIRPTSGAEAAAAAGLAATIGVPCHVVTVALDDGPNLEARARDARRTVLPAGTLTGHTADDRAETMLVNLLRGAGPDGLAALGPAPTRPILALRRTETAGLCAELGLSPVVDPSNTDARFVRNRIRAELLPLMADIAARDVVPLLARTAGLLAGDAALLDDLAAEIDPTDARAVAAAPPALARRAVRRWLAASIGGARAGYPPDQAAVERVLAVAAGRALACELSGGVRVERHHQRLRIAAVGAVVSHDDMASGIHGTNVTRDGGIS
jgi:tRNA(Ile)-lysidine synthase